MSEKQDSLAVQPAQFLEKPEAQSNKLTRLAAFTPVNLTEAVALSKLIASSELAPKDYRSKPGNVLIAMQLGAELGLAPMQSIQNIAVINGRPSVWGDAMLALVQVHPDYEGHKEFMQGSGDNRSAVFQIKRKGQEWHQQTFSVADAKTAGLWAKVGPWKTNPDRMLQMRARGFGLRDKFADALKGLRLAEEAMDIPPEKPTRESGTLDINREITSMTTSSEPNRGHGNEGLVQQPTLSKAPGIDQTQKKQDDVMCSECRQVNGHKAGCPYAQPQCPECHGPAGKHATTCSRKQAVPAAMASPEPEKPVEASPEPSEPQAAVELKPGQEKMLLRVLDVQYKTKGKKGEKDFKEWDVVHVEDGDMNEFDIACWHKSLFESLATAKEQLCVFVVEKKGAYYNLQQILAIGATEFPKA